MKSLNFLLLVTLLLTRLETQDNGCQSDEFECDNGECIPSTWQCDYENDCDTGEDEAECDACESSGYICRSSDKCIPSQWICDAWTDCQLGDDEAFCEACNTTSQYTCNDNECIDIKKRCDFIDDCYNGEDEVGCDACSDVGFTCDSGNTCIAQYKVCDGIIDCSDKSDECECPSLVSPITDQDCLAGSTQAPNTSTSTPAPSGDTLVWKFCDEDTVWLGFVLDSEDSDSVDVYWIEPRLRNEGTYFVTTSEYSPGDEFALGSHTVPYTGTSSGGGSNINCKLNILVLKNMDEDELDACTSTDASVNYMNLVATSGDWKIKEYSNTGTDSTSIGQYYTTQMDKGTACIVTVSLEEGSSSSGAAQSLLDWMVSQVWPVVGIVVGFLLVICVMCAVIVYLLRKNSEYEEAVQDDESESDSEYETPIYTGDMPRDYLGKGRVNSAMHIPPLNDGGQQTTKADIRRAQSVGNVDGLRLVGHQIAFDNNSNSQTPNPNVIRHHSLQMNQQQLGQINPQQQSHNRHQSVPTVPLYPRHPQPQLVQRYGNNNSNSNQLQRRSSDVQSTASQPKRRRSVLGMSLEDIETQAKEMNISNSNDRSNNINNSINEESSINESKSNINENSKNNNDSITENDNKSLSNFLSPQSKSKQESSMLEEQWDNDNISVTATSNQM